MSVNLATPTPIHPSLPSGRSPRGVFLALGLVLALVGVANGAPLTLQPPETLPGFRAGDAIWMSNVDRVSLYSGDVGIRIPLGPTYPISPGFSYGMAATYSVKHWWMDEQTCGDGPVRYARVAGYPTLGVGWALELGFVVQGGQISGAGVIHTPEGAERVFDRQASDPDRVYRTVDGSNIRVTEHRNAQNVTYMFRADHPDGTQYTYRHKYRSPRPVSGTAVDFRDEWENTPYTRWGLTSVTDRFGNEVLAVDYVSGGLDGDLNDPNAWKIEKVKLLQETEQTVQYAWTTLTVAGVTWPVLESLELPAVDGGALTVGFVYNTPGGSGSSPSFARNGFATTNNACSDPTTASLPMLDEIRYRLGATVLAKYRFTYSLGTAGTGVLTDLELPTGGKISYGYDKTAPSTRKWFGSATETTPDPETGGEPPAAPPGAPEEKDLTIPVERHEFYLDKSLGVVSRAEFDPVTETTSTTTYTRRQWANLGPIPPGYLDPNRIVRRTIVTEMTGNGQATRVTKHLFAAGVGERFAPNLAAGLEFQTRIYEDDRLDGPLVRSAINCYESDHPSAPICGIKDPTNNFPAFSIGPNPRQSRQVVWYAENPANGAAGDCANGRDKPCYESVWSVWNPTAKAFEKETTQIDATSPGGGRANPSTFLVSRNFLRREKVTSFSSWIESPFASPYLPARVTSESTKDTYSCPAVEDFDCGGLTCHIAPCEAKTAYAYKSTLPAFVETVTQHRAESGGTGTILTTRTVDPDNRGNASSVTVQGDSNPLVTGTPFTSTRDYRNGEVVWTRREGLPVSWKSFDVTRDFATGLVRKSSDPNGLETAYTFDVLGRLTAIDPPGSPSDPSPREATTTICYVPYSASPTPTPAHVLVKKGVPGACTTALDADPTEGTGTVEAYANDGFGRLLREIKLLPNAQSTGSFFAVRETRYSVAGPRSFVSEWTPCALGASARDLKGCFTTATTTGTTLSGFDPYGRPRTIVATDGTRVTKRYANVSAGITHSESDEYTYTEGVAVDGAPSTVVVAKRTDILGRVIAVSDPGIELSPPPFSAPPPILDGVGAITSYEWNVLDKLGRVMQERGSVKQKRLFGYSSLGLLTSESHPEKGTSTVTLYDALGSALSRTDSGETYSSAYDAAGRLTSLSAGGQTYLSNEYDGVSGSGSAYPKGRLTRQRSYHPESFENAEVQDVFSFDSVQGRPTKKATTVRRAGGATALAVEETYSWSALGLLAGFGRPRPAGVTALEQTYYRAGHPTRTSFLGSNVLTSATYGPSGALQSYATRNGVTTAIAQDPSLLPRPSRISTSGASENLDTGTFTYDGAGNITAMATGLATDTFRYDVLGRLTSSSLSFAGGPYGDEFEYDGFHNLTRHEVRRNGSLQGDYAFATDPVTNHLVGERYDPRGNLKTFAGTGLPAGADYMFYDRLDRMLGYGKSSSPAASQEEYLYDGTGERLVRVMAVSALAVTTAALPDGYVGGAYAKALSATGGRLPYGWAYSGSLPPGLQLDAGGRLSGVPTQSGSFSFTLRVSDGTSIAYRPLSVTIQGPPRFYTLTPCRLLDTRNPNGALGGPRLGWSGDDAQRTFPAAGSCGIPAHATAIAVNVTTVNEAGGSGWVKAFPAGLSTAPMATVTAYVPRRPVRATQAMIGLNGPTPGWFVLKNEPLLGQAAAPIQVIVDVSGYFAPASPASGRPVEASGPSGLSAPTTPRSALAAGGVWYFTFRNGAKKPTAEYEQSTLTRDSFYLGNLLLATAEYASGTAWKFYSSDHLGTPRLVTNSTGTALENRSYRPYGLTLDVFSPPARGFGFAGMEREASNLSTQASFDHARQVSSWIGRFQAVDSANGRIDDPMSWNRYVYARNNPLKYVDPDGRATRLAESIAGSIEAAGTFVSDAGGSLNGGGVTGILLDTSLGTVGDVVGGFGDMFRVGDAMGEVAGFGGDLHDVTMALATDFGRATQLFVTVGAAASPLSGVGPKLGSSGGPGAGARFSEATKAAARAESGQCVFCGTQTTKAPGPLQSNIDHAVAKSKGGNNTLANAQNTCRSCNLDKRTMSSLRYALKQVFETIFASGNVPPIVR